MTSVQVFGTTNELLVEVVNGVLEITHAPTMGVQGPAGPAGTQILSGATDPPSNSLGVNGDFYYVTSDPVKIYGPKADGAWPASPFFIDVNRRYVHNQTIAASTWNITHNLGGKPSVTVVDSANTEVVGDVTYNSETSITLNFTGSFSGYAYLT